MQTKHSVLLIAFFFLLSQLSGTTAQTWTNGQAALKVIGQPYFSICNTGLSSASLNGPTGIAIDRNNRKLWVAELGNHRLLRYSLDSLQTSNSSAELVLGQLNFNAAVANYSLPGQVNYPAGLFVDSMGGLWMGDYWNHRVLYWAESHLITTNGQFATKVIGQADFNSVQENRGVYEPQANSLFGPWGVLVDPLDNLWIVDRLNRRVVRYANILAGVSAVGTTGGELAANLVLGEPDFTYYPRLNEHVNSTLDGAYGLAWAGNSLFISDESSLNGRVVRVDNPNSKSNGAVFSGVIGQPTIETYSSFPPNAQSMSQSVGLTDDGQGGIFVADFNYRRVTYYSAPSSFLNFPAATAVLGQPNFTSTVYGDCAQSFTSSPGAVTYDPDTCQLFVSDTSLNRVLVFQASGSGCPRTVAFSVTSSALPNSNLQTVYQILPPNSETPMGWVTDSPPTWQDYGVMPPGGFGIGQAVPEYYTTPQSGWYHFDATVLLLLAFSSVERNGTTTPLPPNQNVDIRLTTACNTTKPWACDCSQTGLAQAGALYLASGSLRPPASTPNGAFVPGAPNYSLSIAWTGKLPALTNVGVCVDNWTFQNLELLCGNGICNFSGFLLP